jgi:cellulose synthase/poly-beta-1,6-N-acetylglucosamine synthase-like glycosyltransferase
VSPFFDPEVGAVMGRVVPWNVGSNLLSRLLDLERSGGYQVDQQARMNMRLVPQYGGTVGGVRKSALISVGGWREDSLSEDTDMTYKMLLAGWKTVYQNRSECYEEVPERWDVRIRQIMRWTKGHNQAWASYSWPLLFSRNVSWRERLDGLLLLGVFVMSPIVLLGWILALLLFYMGESPYLGALTVLAVASYSALGNFAAFFEIAAAGRLDGYRGRIRLLPLNALGFLVSLISTSRAGVQQISPTRRRRAFQWDKTERFRSSPHHGIAPFSDTASTPDSVSSSSGVVTLDTTDTITERERVSS